MKILSTKEFKRLKNIEEFSVELQLDLGKAKEDEKNYISQVRLLNEALNKKTKECEDLTSSYEVIVKNIQKELESLSEKLNDKNKENKRLKTMLTKNKISYAKDNKKEGK